MATLLNLTRKQLERKAYRSLWYQTNKDRLRSKSRRRKKDLPPLSLLYSRLQQRLRKHLLKGRWDNDELGAAVGCELSEFKQHLIRTVIEAYGIFDPNIKYTLSLDIPPKLASSELELKALFHYTNIRWLKPEDARMKGGKIGFDPRDYRKIRL